MTLLLRSTSALATLISFRLAAAEIKPATAGGYTDPVPLAVIILGTALIGLWIWARRK